MGELDRLSFCDVGTSSLSDWIGSLPMANTADAAAQVRHATWEIARLEVATKDRMALLEKIRPTLHYLCARLDRNAAASGNHGDAIARLAQRLQTNLCSGYKSVIVVCLAEMAAGTAREDDRELLPLAIHRALSDLSRTLLRTLQFYVEPAERLWFELNQLYLLAERLGCHERLLEDTVNHTAPQTSAMAAYLRSLLLACCKPNQMRYRQLVEVFNFLESWSHLVTLEADATRAQFAVDLESDHGPIYKRLLQNAVEPRGIRTDALVYQLDAHLRGLDSDILVPENASESQLRHLSDAWGEMRQRSHRRSAAGGDIKVCVGMRSAHYFLCGGVEFADWLNDPTAYAETEANPFLVEPPVRSMSEPPAVKDVWDDAFDLRTRIPENPNIADPSSILRQGRQRKVAETADAERPDHIVFNTLAIDTSPGGYQIRWCDPLPPHLQTGEILAMHDAEEGGWCIAIIRWIRQNQDGTAMGIELVSPRAIPAAVRVIRKVGGPTTYTRALLLPELTPIGQPPTLLTPRVPFQPGQKVHIQEQAVRNTAQLSRCVLKTESVSQFTYRMLSGYLENGNARPKMSEQ